MAKKQPTVQEILGEIGGRWSDKTGKLIPNRFNKKKFNKLMLAMINDIDFQETVVTKFDGENPEYEDIMVSKGFRKWCKHLVEKAGIDSMESDIVMDKSFYVDHVDGLYEFISAALYEYMRCGNKFEFLSTDDFMGTLEIKDVPEDEKETNPISPKTGEKLGTFKVKKLAHKELKAKSKTPDWLVHKKKIK